MAPKLIYYGSDNSHRLSVLQAAGYIVENCKSAPELVSVLESDAEILAILFSDEEPETPLEAVGIARARCSAPQIIFHDSTALEDEIGFDFIIANLTPPSEWLKDVASLIEETRRSSFASAPSGKVRPFDAIPNKIKVIERDSALTNADLRSFEPPLKNPQATQETAPINGIWFDEINNI